MFDSLEEKKEIENVIEIFHPYIINEPRIDIIFSSKFGYLLLVCAEGEDDQIIKIETHDELIWRLFWEISLAVRNLDLDGAQMFAELYPNEEKELRRWIAVLLDGSNQRSKLKGEIQALLESFLDAYPYDIFT